MRINAGNVISIVPIPYKMDGVTLNIPPNCDWDTCAGEGRYEEVVRLQETLCGLKRQFQELQLKDVDKDQIRQRGLYKAAQKVILEYAMACHRYSPLG